MSDKGKHDRQAQGSRKNKKKRRFLSAGKKFQIFLEVLSGGKPIGEILRREGLFATDLARIRQQVRQGALERLRAKPGAKPKKVSGEAYKAMKRELEEKERVLAEQAVELSILRKKKEWGFAGEIKRGRLSAERKAEVLALIDEAKACGISMVRSCEILALDRRRVARWRKACREGLSLENRRPGPVPGHSMGF